MTSTVWGKKGQKRIVLSVDAQKTFNKIQHIFMIKALSKLAVERNFPNLIKNIYNKAK